MALLIRMIIFILILFLIYAGIRYLLSPKRKLELAHEQNRFYFLDDPDNVRKNFFITYKGALFEGEKKLGTTPESFDVVSVLVTPKNINELKGLTKKDFQIIEQHILKHYPSTEIEWQSPVREFLGKLDNQSDQSFE